MTDTDNQPGILLTRVVVVVVGRELAGEGSGFVQARGCLPSGAVYPMFAFDDDAPLS
jgi:hypothetical protein